MPSTIVNAPIPGSTSDFNISVPSPVAFIRQTWAASKVAWPWSPHNLSIIKIVQWKISRHIKEKEKKQIYMKKNVIKIIEVTELFV